ncbi:MAG: hypothetical protein IH959_06370 [Chloroflexi bacterium]|nr:hypothetical protein [Chloroflexota bacterium]
MYVDSHVHLQPHGEQPPITLERIRRYVEAASANGIARIALTEHLFRFREAYELLHGWWDADSADPALSAIAHAYWKDHVSVDVADYVRVVEEAKSAGLPVLLGIEMDWLSGRGDDLRRFLAPYDWDIVLGSVHWIGAWQIDTPDGANWAEWAQRSIDEVHAEYGALLRELAASKLSDVLAHPDLPKIHGHRPTSFTPLHESIVEAAADSGCAVELNSNGYNAPVAEAYPALPVIERARAAGLSITLASDAHRPKRVGERFDDLAALAARAGYREYASFEARRPTLHSLVAAAARTDPVAQ